MEFRERLFELKDIFWKDYKDNDGNLDLKMYEHETLIKDLLINYFNNFADYKIAEAIKEYNTRNCTDITPFEMLEDLLPLREKINQLPSSLIIGCMHYNRNGKQKYSENYIKDYKTYKSLEPNSFEDEIEVINNLSNKYTNFPLELIGEFLDYLEN